MAGMPFMPMGGGAGAGDQNRDRDGSSVGLSGDEGDWEDDIGTAPAVLGQES